MDIWKWYKCIIHKRNNQKIELTIVRHYNKLAIFALTKDI